MSQRPLAGIRVIDFCWVGAGSYTTRVLADLGADVVKIESSTRLDQIRLSPPFKDRIRGVNRSGYFADRNAGKRSITVNLKSDRGRDVALALLSDAHVVTNNFSPGTMDRLGLSYDEVRERNPSIIFVEMSMQGADGPNSRQVGYGMTIGAVAGLQYLVGEEGRPPTGTGTNYPDHVPSPGHAAFAILAAVRHQRRSGEGQYVELAQTEATVAALGPYVLAQSIGQHVSTQDNAALGVLFNDALRVDGVPEWVAVSVRTAEEWYRLLAELDLDAIVEPADVARMDPAEQSGVRRWLEEATRRFEAYDLQDRLQTAGLAAGVVQTAREVVEHDPQLRHRGHWSRLPHEEIGDCLYNVLPIRFASIDVRPSVGAPLLGEHTEEVLRQAGVPAAELAELQQSEVLT